MKDLALTVLAGAVFVVGGLAVIAWLTRRSRGRVTDDLSESWRNEHAYDKTNDRWK